jgi:hypothetical protein
MCSRTPLSSLATRPRADRLARRSAQTSPSSIRIELRLGFQVGTQVGTRRVNPTHPAHLTRMTMRNWLNRAKEYGPGRTRTGNRPAVESQISVPALYRCERPAAWHRDVAWLGSLCSSTRLFHGRASVFLRVLLRHETAGGGVPIDAWGFRFPVLAHRVPIGKSPVDSRSALRRRQRELVVGPDQPVGIPAAFDLSEASARPRVGRRPRVELVQMS